MAKVRRITRKVVEGRKVKVYEVDGEKLNFLEELFIKGKVSEKELAEKHNVKKVVAIDGEEVVKTYGMDVDTFMQYAELIEDDKEDEIEE